MKHLPLVLAVFFSSLLVSTTSLRGASRDYPNADLCPAIPDGVPAENVPLGVGGKMRVIAKYKPSGDAAVSIDTGANIGLLGCYTGQKVTVESARNLCQACDALPGGDPVVSGTLMAFDCATLSDLINDAFDCVVNGVARIKVDNKPIGDPPLMIPSVDVIPKTASTALIGLTSTTNAGNVVAADLLPNLIVQVTPGPSPGPVTVTVDLYPNVSPPPVSITTAGKTQLTIHQDLAAVFMGLGYTNVQVIAPDDPPEVFQTQGMFTDGPYVFVPDIGTLNGNAVARVKIKGGLGDLLEMENSVLPSATAVPAMSAWSIVLLVTLLLLTGAWLLRQRQVAPRPD